MIRHTVLMPFARLRFADILREHMRGQKVEWRPLTDGNELVAYQDGKEERRPADIRVQDFSTNTEDSSWIKPWRCPGEAQYNVGHWVCDRFLDAQIGQGDKNFFSMDHYVSFMTDDCLWCNNHWLKLRRHFQPSYESQERGWQAAAQFKNVETPKVIVCAYKAGGVENPGSYRDPTKEPNNQAAWAAWRENSCRTFLTKFEVLTVRADLLRDERFGPLWCADGFMVERLVEKHGMTPANDTMIYANALRPECWGFPSTHQR